MLKTNNNIDFNKVNKNLKDELATMGFQISNQSCLNLLARATGYKNYNTYLALNPKNIEIDKKISVKDYLSEETNKFLRFSNKDSVLNYYELEKIVYLSDYKQYEIFIDKELASGIEKYFLQFRLKNNLTKRVLFAPEFKSFSLYVYPTFEETHSDYHFQIEHFQNKEHLKFFFKDYITHLNEKRWYTKEIHNDLIDLMNFVYNEEEELYNISKQYTEEFLKDNYIQNVPDFYK